MIPLQSWLTEVGARLERCKSDLVLGNAKTRTDLTLAVKIIGVLAERLESVVAKSQNAVAIRIEECPDFDRLLFTINESFKGSSATIIIYSAESVKMPTITHSETLF